MLVENALHPGAISLLIVETLFWLPIGLGDILFLAPISSDVFAVVGALNFGSPAATDDDHCEGSSRRLLSFGALDYRHR